MHGGLLHVQVPTGGLRLQVRISARARETKARSARQRSRVAKAFASAENDPEDSLAFRLEAVIASWYDLGVKSASQTAGQQRRIEVGSFSTSHSEQ